MIDLLLSALCITIGIVLGVVIILYSVIKIGLWYCIKARKNKNMPIKGGYKNK